MHDNSPDQEKLDSWKEIATYLDRDVSTVQRWEKEEDLPVRRHLHYKRATIYAYPSEIDAWLENRRTESSASLPIAPAKRIYFWAKIGGAIIVLVLLALALPRPSTPPAPEEAIDSIAVLLIENQSGNPEWEYLTEGIAGDVIYSLSKLPGLRVMPTGAVVRYKGQEITPQRVADDLKVRAVVTGTATQQGENLSLRVELVDTQEDRLLWGRQYVKKPTDILALQEDIARDISESLRLQLSGVEQEQLSKRYTTNPEAHQDYLQGRFHSRTNLPEDLEKAVEYFNSAINKDPGYALAYAGLADAYHAQAVYSGRSVEGFYQQELSAAQRALELNDTLSEAHTVMGAIKAMDGWDWAAGEEHLTRALELNPNDIRAYQVKGSILGSKGHRKETGTLQFDGKNTKARRRSGNGPCGVPEITLGDSRYFQAVIALMRWCRRETLRLAVLRCSTPLLAPRTISGWATRSASSAAL